MHRQFVIRTLGISAAAIAAILENLSDIILEYTVSDRHGLYGWQCRHDIIAEVLTRYKYHDQDELFKLFDTVVNNLNTSYDIEVWTIRQICDVQRGIVRIRDRRKQNFLFRKLISIAPAERVPRHRLVYNLIEQNELQEAEREIRLFEKELGMDPPILRYKIKMAARRAESARGLMVEDRSAIIQDAAGLAEGGIRSYPNDKNMYRAFLEVGIAYARQTGRWDIYDAAHKKARTAEETLLDPDFRRIITTFEGVARRLARGAA